MSQQQPPFPGEPPNRQPQGDPWSAQPEGSQQGYQQQPPPGGYPQQGGYQPPPGGYPQQGGWGPQGPGGPNPYVIGGPQPPKRNKRSVVIAAGVVAAMAIAGGAYAAVSLTGTSDKKAGSNKQDNNDGNIVALRNSALKQVDSITNHFPTDTVAVATINLNPGQDETVATLKYLRKFPSIQREAPTGSTLSDGLLKPLVNAAGSGANYETDVKPWFGGQVAAGADVVNGKARPIIVVKITDPAKAKAGIGKLLKDSPHNGMVIDGDYAVVSDSQAHAASAQSEAKASSLSTNTTFRDNMSKVPGDSPVTAWVDVKAALKLSKQTLPNHSQTTGLTGKLSNLVPNTVAGSLRFDQSYADFSVVSFGGGTSLSSGGHVGAKVSQLPSETAIALGASGTNKAVASLWRQVQKNPTLARQVNQYTRQVQQQLGVLLPDDLETLVGSQTLLAVGGPELSEVGGLSVTDPQKAYEIATKVIGKIDPQSRQKIVVKKTSDGIAVANSDSWATKLGTNGSLGTKSAFQNAVPNAANADLVLYVDVPAVAEAANRHLPPDAAPLAAVGLTMIQDGDATAAHLRIVTK
ncbi:MAG: hypothetical protein ACR2F6_11905 [Mycobacteriales bacterium]